MYARLGDSTTCELAKAIKSLSENLEARRRDRGCGSGKRGGLKAPMKT
jgi:hypothetical protein